MIFIRSSFIEMTHFYCSLKSDTKWLSWLAYQFHMAVSGHGGAIGNLHSNGESMNIETFKKSFYFKVVSYHRVSLCIVQIFIL